MSESNLYETVMASVPDGAVPVARIKASAGVVPWRRRTGTLEVFWVERAREMPFMGGFFAFPGGGRSRLDRGIRVRGNPAGLGSAAVDPGLPEALAEGLELEPADAEGILACAARELFEETGVLLGTDADAQRLATARHRLLAGETSFGELVGELGVQVDASALVYAGRWLTPALGPVRFDNRFFLLELPAEGQTQPVVCGGELVAGEWIAPQNALERWRRGEVITAPPILHILRVLAEDGPTRGLSRLRDTREANLGPHRRVEFRPGVLMLPLPTPTLPPATHTNAYLLGCGETVLVDPGSPFPEAREGLVAALSALAGEGRTLREIWLTHHHPDHVGAVEAVRAAFRVPVRAHRLTGERLASRGLRVDGELRDGETQVLAGTPALSIRILHTPGHTRGHLAFFDEEYGSLVAGDLTAGIGTIVIDPPEGDMAEYLESLRRIRDLGARTLFPAHGPPTIAVREKCEETLRHRIWREERILAAWRKGLRTDELLKASYDGLAARALPLARRQLFAHLLHLEATGRIPEGAGAGALA